MYGCGEVLENKENIDETLENALSYIKDTEEFYKYKPKFQIVRLENLKNIIQLLKEENQEEQVEKFQNQFAHELANKETYLLDYNKARYPKQETQNYKEKIEELKKWK